MTLRPANMLLAMLASACCASCASIPYDDETDKLVTQLQSDIDTEMVTLISLESQVADLGGKTDPDSVAALAEARKKLAYAANLDAYNKIRVDLISLQLRVDASPNATTPALDFDICKLKQALFGLDTVQERAVCEAPPPNPPVPPFASFHRQGEINASFVMDTERLLDSELKGLLAYEAVLKGPGGSSASGAAAGASAGKRSSSEGG